MSAKLDFYCVLQGEVFDPTFLLSNPSFNVQDYHRKGDIAKLGRYKGTSYNFGYIRFSSKKDDLNNFLQTLDTSDIMDFFSSASSRELHLFLQYTDQCNWELSHNELKSMATLGMVLTIACDTK